MSINQTENSSTTAFMQSAIYTGTVWHRRLAPKAHAFRYRVFMMYLDLNELQRVFQGTPLWSTKRPALAWFRRADFLNPAEPSLDKAVRDYLHERTGERISGPIRLLTNLRYFGFIINPISCYYCFDQNESLRYIIAEVTNTPWRESTGYVIPCKTGTSHQHVIFDKQLHVSPFMPMDMQYSWKSSTPDAGLRLQLENFQAGDRVFNAGMRLHRRSISPWRLNCLLLSYPFMTLQVALGIYWQALRLYLKGIPLLNHPATAANKPRPERS